MTEREAGALEIVRRHSTYSAGLGLIPFPLVDLFALLAMDIKMLKALADYYGLDFSEQRGKSFASALIGGGVGTKLGWGTVRSMAKAIPGIGALAGFATMPAFAAASTFALGKVFIQHFESGGTFLDFDPEKVRAHYESEFKAASEAGVGTASEDDAAVATT